MANDLQAWAQAILFGTSLSEKLLAPEGLQLANSYRPIEVDKPGRSERIAISEKQIKFPKRPSLGKPENKAIALHAFANHELLAIEMMAAALLIYPHDTDELARWKRGMVQTIREEQKHLQLYCERMREFGHDLGDFPLNGFFWNQLEKLTTPQEFTALMSLTFESANLDFALHYRDIFKSHDDEVTAHILQQVYDDEVGHVAFGAHWMNRWRGDQTLWDYYRSVLPFPNTPARSRGSNYLPETRLAAGLGEEFTKALGEFRDDFNITNRRSWKNNESAKS